MSRTPISNATRQRVIVRAENRCEYCHYPQSASFFVFEIEHIISEKHGGETALENLALACPFCNRFKGTDLGSLDPETRVLTLFFNPRSQAWQEHFRFDGTLIVPLTATGRVTVNILQMNHSERIAERERLVQVKKLEP